jgi:hypothetical protein
MRRFHLLAVILSLAVIQLAACDRNQREDPRSEADKQAGRTLKAPGDSIRLEDTLSTPPPSKDTARTQR